MNSVAKCKKPRGCGAFCICVLLTSRLQPGYNEAATTLQREPYWSLACALPLLSSEPYSFTFERARSAST